MKGGGSAVADPAGFQNDCAQVQDVLKGYQIVTDVSRVHDLEIPEHLDWGLGPVKVPRRMRAKDVHYLVDSQGQIVRACWLNRALGLFLNSQRGHLNAQARSGQLEAALKQVDMEIGQLLKKDLLTNRRGPGAMSFSQAHEKVPEDAVLISARTYASLCEFNRGWLNTREVMAVRYPNLGPGTTRRLRLLINGHPPREEVVESLQNLRPTQLGSRLPALADLLRAVSDDEDWEDEQTEDQTLGIVDAFYLHPKTLKESFEGDGDGDVVYLSRLRRGKPTWMPLSMVRTPCGAIPDELWEQMAQKANRTVRVPLAEYLPKYMDSSLLIAQATYAIRFQFFLTLLSLPASPEAMRRAWEMVSPWAIWLLEFVMDMRKGEHSAEEILKVVSYLNDTAAAIREAQAKGVWFARVVTSSSTLFPEEFIDRFSDLQQFADYLSHSGGRPPVLSDLLKGEALYGN